MTFGLAPGKLGFKIGDVLVGLQSGTTDVPETISSTQNKLHTIPYMWNPDTLAYEVPQQPLTDAELRATPVPISGKLGVGDLITTAWGTQKVSLDHSVFHGMWTFDIPPSMWFMYENGTQVYTSTNIVSANGAGTLTTSAAKTALVLESRECPRYQPNRGHLFSSALILASKTSDGIREFGAGTTENRVLFRLKADGLLYAVLHSGGAQVYEQLIDTSGVAGFDVQKGNVYDIQYQWRGVGNYYFYINLTLVHAFEHLGALSVLSLENPALPIRFAATRTTQDVAIVIGCADLTSENGEDNNIEQYGSAYSENVTVNGTNVPVLVIHNPLQINGETNTRTISLARISVSCSKKATFKVWETRDPGNLTGETLVAIGNGSFVQTDSTDMTAGTVRATAATVASMRFITALPVEASVRGQWDNPYRDRIELPVVRGDYIVVTCTATAATAECVVEWGEQI